MQILPQPRRWWYMWHLYWSHTATTYICIVESERDVWLLRYGSVSRLYHVLGGIISPIEGMALRIFISTPYRSYPAGEITELIMAISPPIEAKQPSSISATTKTISVRISLLQGVYHLEWVEYADGLTLGDLSSHERISKWQRRLIHSLIETLRYIVSYNVIRFSNCLRSVRQAMKNIEGRSLSWTMHLWMDCALMRKHFQMYNYC